MTRFFLFALALLLILLTALGFGSPMVLMFPLWIVTVLLQAPLRNLLSRLPGSTGFLLAVVLYGLAIETFAILTNLDRPPEQRILLDPRPLRDLTMAAPYYLFVGAAWWLLLRRVRFSRFHVFLLTGVYGIFVEESGGVVARIFTQPVTGILYALLVMMVYGLFPMLALSVSEERFSPSRRRPNVKDHVLALVALFLQYAVYGNTVYPFLKHLP